MRYFLLGLLIGISLSTFPTEVVYMDYEYMSYGIDVYDYSGHRIYEATDEPCDSSTYSWSDL